jgi:hypothetical protein
MIKINKFDSKHIKTLILVMVIELKPNLENQNGMVMVIILHLLLLSMEQCLSVDQQQKDVPKASQQSIFV